MDIHPTRTPADHTAALAEIERLFDAAPGTPEADKLDILATLVERYEEHLWPVSDGDPVEISQTAASTTSCHGPIRHSLPSAMWPDGEAYPGTAGRQC